MSKVQRTVVMIEGDGIGPEICAAVRRVVDAADVGITWDVRPAGEGAMATHGDALPEQTLTAIRACGVGIKGPTNTPHGTGHRSANVRLREALNLFAGVRPVRTVAGVRHPLAALGRQVDMVVVRENLEDLYVGAEHVFGKPGMLDAPEQLRGLLVEIMCPSGVRIPYGAAVALKVITPHNTERICRFAFEYARKNRRKKVTCVHKSNILKVTDGLFLRIFREVAMDFPDIMADDFIVDAASMRLVRNPEHFDVLVCPNLYGDILSDLCAGLVGGLGVAAGANIGERCAVYEAVHGTAPDIAGQGKANPTALLRSAVMMLRDLGEEGAANTIATAAQAVLLEPTLVTPDLGGTATTMGMAEAIASRVAIFARIGRESPRMNAAGDIVE